MRTVFNYTRFLTDEAFIALFSFTLFLTLLIHTHPACGLENGVNPSALSGMSNDNSTTSTSYEEAKHERIHEVLGYLRQQAPTLIPGLPDFVRAPARWAMGGVSILESGFDFGDSGLGGFNDEGLMHGVHDALVPVANMMHAPDDEVGQANWVTPGYNHKGFLPNHDAMVLAFNSRHRMMNDFLQFDVKPFYGQNWHKSENYYGMETSINIGQRGNDDHARPWGKISFRYAAGEDDLIDRGHGIIMRTEINFNEHLSLHAGVRESDAGTSGNYVLMRWKLAELGH